MEKTVEGRTMINDTGEYVNSAFIKDGIIRRASTILKVKISGA